MQFLGRRSVHFQAILLMIVAAACVLSTHTFANESTAITAQFISSEQRMSVADAVENDFSSAQHLNQHEVILLRPDLDYWFKVELNPSQCQGQVCYLLSHNPSLLHINYYAFIEGQLVADSASGSMSPDPDRYLGASMPITGDELHTVFINIRSERMAYFSFDYLNDLVFQSKQQEQWLLWFAFVGLMSGFLIYCAAMCIAYKESVYGFFALYIASSTILLLVQTGITKLILPYMLHSFLLQYIGLLGSLSGVSILLFLAKVLRIERDHRVYHHIVNGLMIACCLLAACSLFLPIAMQMVAMRVLVGLILIVAITLSIKSKHDERRDWLLFLSWFPYVGAYCAMIWLFVAPYPNGIYIHAMFAIATMANCILIGIDFTIRERRSLNKHRQQVYWDKGTGLPNKQLFYKVLHLIQSPNLTLIMFKPKGLVEARANFGIDHSDNYIKRLIEQTEKQLVGLPLVALSEEHFICRFSDDIFALALDGDLEISTIEQTVCVVNAVFNEGVAIDNTHFIDQVDFGVANIPIHTNSKQQLVRFAMQALYRDKNSNQRWHMYSPEDCIRSQKRLSLASDLRVAIDREQFQIHLQPQIDLITEEVYGAEVLIRWFHPEKGMISPVEFIPIAESAGLISEITEWVITEAIKTQAQILEQRQKHVISINISGRDLSNRALPSHILSVLQEFGVPPSSIMLELTESSTIGGKKSAISMLNEFRQVGVQIAIDDFGTGYSSLAYLSYLGFNELKIDKQFVSNIANSPKDQSICQSTCGLAESLQATVVAEGIEDIIEAQYMAGYGCQLGQGYYFAKPMPVEDYYDWVNLDHDFGLLSVLKSKNIG
ncbi:EAL domain-containing protein [Pseudoalteromonas sp. YIC-656]|uniref:putative bifunctional diguanylate cyclase/phosphodiesterase n=1 Tax=Pseudoalteromonas pernae TaxID=3118054 RepID=UPI003242AB01